jgi:hypothetical protein
MVYRKEYIKSSRSIPPQVVHNFSLSNMFMQQDRHIIRNNITVPRIVIVVSMNWIIRKQEYAFAKAKPNSRTMQRE